MHSERLTRQELTWLLTQEARSAAEKLRKGVLAGPEIRGATVPPPTSFEPELDALDDAMKMLATLYAGGPTRSRRGRIDLAALLYEVAPSARVSLEPGSGTEVFGDETELRRMLQVLVGSTNPAGGGGEMGTPELSVRREGAEIRVSVTLGPDSSANAGTERAWLSRMATRYGGRLELEGGMASIMLPADGATDQREVEDLRRELEAAQRQGEAYARELAAVFSYSQSSPPRFSSSPAELNKSLNAISAMAAGVSVQLRSLFGALSRNQAGANRDRPSSFPPALGEPLELGTELVTELARLAECPVYESVQHLNFADAVRSAMAELESRAARRGVHLKGIIPNHADIESRPATAALLARTLIHDAILATPPGGTVKVSVEAKTKGLQFTVIDGGGPVSEDVLTALIANRTDPSTLGRPCTIALFVGQSLAQHLGAQLELAPAIEGEAPGGGRILVRLGA
ncbi:MAG TPA: sensor histidine kinase [Polyangiaceae bacterium]|nr:sensor histidine kinase [Polyangiaceae bacterium]